MISSLSWQDADGYVVLTNDKPEVATRFADWVVHRKPVGPSVVGLGTAQTFVFEFRQAKTASFSIVGIPEADMEKMVRLQYHLLSGHSISLAGDRAMASDFALSMLAPGTEPEVSQSDAQLREYTLSLVVQPLAGVIPGEDYYPPAALILPLTGTLSVTGYAPTLPTALLKPGRGQVSATGYAPSLSTSVLTPAAGQVGITGYPPMI